MPEAEAGPACPVPPGPALGRAWLGPCQVGVLPSLGALCSPALLPPVGDLRDFVRSHLGNPELPFYLCEFFTYSLLPPPPRASHGHLQGRVWGRGGQGGRRPSPCPTPVHPLLLAWPPGPGSWGGTPAPLRGHVGGEGWGPPEAVLQVTTSPEVPWQRRGGRGLLAEGSSEYPAGPGLPLCLQACLPRECGQGVRRARRDGEWGVGGQGAQG